MFTDFYNLFYNFWGLNKSLFLLINHFTNISFLPLFFKITSQVLTTGNFPVYYLLVCGYFYIKARYSSDPFAYFNLIYPRLVQTGVCYVLFALSYSLLKFSTNIPRPFCSLQPGEFITVIDITEERCLSGFPSAHVGLAIMIVYFIWAYLNSFQRLCSCLAIILIAISRIALAMHYPADLVYSAIIIIFIIKINNYLFIILQKLLFNPIGEKIARYIL